MEHEKPLDRPGRPRRMRGVWQTQATKKWVDGTHVLFSAMRNTCSKLVTCDNAERGAKPQEQLAPATHTRGNKNKVAGRGGRAMVIII